MIADGLHALHHSIKDVRENYQATKRNMQQGVDNLDSEIRETGKFTFVHERNLRKDLGKVQLFSTFENFTAKQKFPNSRMHLSAISVDEVSLSKQKMKKIKSAQKSFRIIFNCCLVLIGCDCGKLAFK